MQKVRIAAAGAAVAALALGGSLAATAQAADSNLSNAARPAAKAVVSPHAAFPRMFAGFQASSTGLTLVKQRGLSSFTRLGTGVYDVRFLGGIGNCSWTGTVGFPIFSGSTGASSISVTGRAGTNNGLFVQTFASPSGLPTDLPFTVLVVCS